MVTKPGKGCVFHLPPHQSSRWPARSSHACRPGQTAGPAPIFQEDRRSPASVQSQAGGVISSLSAPRVGKIPQRA